ncbi:MAG: hypothetical protein MOB07_14165 [Acidobacteria bacterium]|nr:hypothetical protein [Acidobacteriota bacterium]MCI0662314.1 hypothetical protein [Acidobacteriota bacterium]
MNSAYTRMHVYNRKDVFPGGFRAAASLHCHTYHSKELLTFIPRYAAMIPIIARLFKRGMDRHFSLYDKMIDFSRAYWTPTVSPRQVLEIETLQIEKELGLPAFVSITDHDDIEAGQQLRMLNEANRVPISLEWTVPYGRGFFHLGVHNLPNESATEVARELTKYTRRADDAMKLDDLLVLLNKSAETLVVLNHPMWDVEFIGAEEHTICLRAFLSEYGPWIHALEINGFRSWRENMAAMRLAEDLGIPAVAGGDRHGCQANTLLNLTRASSFGELVAEIREDAHSEILLLPEYRESLVARTIEAVADVLRHYPAHPLGQARWVDRTFVDLGDGCGTCPISRHWQQGGPSWVRVSLWCLRLLGSHRVQPALRLALANEKVVSERMGYEG